MAEVLSQQEIDQLLNNMQTGETESGSSSEVNREAVPFDFRLPNRISKNQIRTIRNIHENFSESFSSFLMNKLQSIININVISVDQIYYSEYVLSVSNPACLYTFGIEHTDIKGILELSTELAFTLVDRLLGGGGSGSKKSKIITPIEQKVLVEVVSRVMKDLRKAWQIIDDFEFSIDRFEPDIDFAQITSQSESVLLVTLELFIGDQSYLMNVCFATYAFDSILQKLSNQNTSTIRPVKYHGGTSAKNIIKQHLAETELGISVMFGKALLSFKQVMELQNGDVIILDKKVGDEVDVKVNQKVLFKGSTGNVNGHKAVKVTKKIEIME